MTDNDVRRGPARRSRAGLIDTVAPNAARVADYLHGRRNNFDADRKAVRAMLATAPAIAQIMPAARAFHQRVVRYLATEAGLRQFLDIGIGLTGPGGTHEIAQSAHSACRIVCVDSDPMVLSHARALMKSTRKGAVAAVEADISDPAAILAGAAATLDLRKPVGVLLPSTLAFIPRTSSAAAVVSALMAAVPSGSYLALYHLASDLDPALPAVVGQWNGMSAQRITLRSRAEVASFTLGLDLVEPGLAQVTEWRPESADLCREYAVPMYGVVARKP